MHAYCDIMIWIAAFGVSGLLLDVFKIKSIRHRFMYYMLYLISGVIILRLIE